MTTHATHAGGCHCGALRWRFETAHALPDVAPRACDCDFCTRHRAAWVSDPEGRLTLDASGDALQRYRQGSGQAEFLVCGHCGVLVAVVARTMQGHLIGAANRNAFDARMAFGEETVVSPQRLAAEAKLQRWSGLWTPAEVRVDAVHATR